MQNTTVVPVSSNITGDITICKIETAPIRVDRSSPLSLFETTTYRSYDVCTKATIDTYIYQSLTPLAAFSALAVGGVIVLSMMALFSSDY